MLSEKREAAADDRDNCCGKGREEEGSEEDERDEGGVGKGEESSWHSPCTHDTGTGEEEQGRGEEGIMGPSNGGGGVVEAEEVQLSWPEDGEDVATGLTLWPIMSTPRPLLLQPLIPFVLMLLLLLLLLLLELFDLSLLPLKK